MSKIEWIQSLARYLAKDAHLYSWGTEYGHSEIDVNDLEYVIWEWTKTLKETVEDTSIDSFGIGYGE